MAEAIEMMDLLDWHKSRPDRYTPNERLIPLDVTTDAQFEALLPNPSRSYLDDSKRMANRVNDLHTEWELRKWWLTRQKVGDD